MRSAPVHLALSLLALTACSSLPVDPPECDLVTCGAGRCTIDAERRPFCTCSAFEQAEGAVCEIAYVREADADNSPDTAQPLVLGAAPVRGQLVPGDSDFVSWTARAEAVYRVRARAAEGQPFAFPELQVRVPSGAVSQRVVDEAEGTVDLWIETRSPGTAVVDLRTRADGASWYEVNVAEFPEDPPDGLEISPGDSFGGMALPPGGDLDAWQVRAGENEILAVSCEPTMQLVTMRGRDVVNAGTGRLTLKEPAALEDLTLQVRRPLGVEYQCTATSAGLDDHPDDPAATTEVPPGPFTFRTDTSDDVDVMRFSGVSGVLYKFVCAPDCSVEPDYFVGSSGYTWFLEFTGTVGDHTVTWGPRAPDDFPDSTWVTVPAIGGGTTTGRGDSEDDTDLMQFNGSASAFYRFEAAGPGRCTVTELDDYTVHEGCGPLQVRGPVRIRLDELPSQYTVTITTLGADDFPESVVHVLRPNIGLTIKVQSLDDRDYFRFEAPHGNYRMELSVSPPGGANISAQWFDGPGPIIFGPFSPTDMVISANPASGFVPTYANPAVVNVRVASVD